MLKGIIILIVIVLIVLFFTKDIDAIKGTIKKQKQYNIKRIKPNQKIIFMGDSITNGYISQGGLTKDFQGYRGIISKQLSKINIQTSNYAVGGYKVEDVVKQIKDNVSINDVNEKIIKLKAKDDITSIYPTNIKCSHTIIENIKEADKIIITIGANNIVADFLTNDNKEKIKFKNSFSKMKQIRKNKKQLFSTIHAINPKVQIYDIGMYFAYPHRGKLFMRMLYPPLILVEKIIFINDRKNNIKRVVVRDVIQSDIIQNIDNPKDIHPSIKGHEEIASIIFKALEE